MDTQSQKVYNFFDKVEKMEYNNSTLYSYFSYTMKKLFITLGVIAVLIFGGYLYLNRPLPYEIENISESRFDLPKRKNPSALSKLEAIFTDDNETLKRLLDREENRHDDLSGSLLNEANREKVMQKITPDFRRDLATIQDQMRPLLSGYDFYIKS